MNTLLSIMLIFSLGPTEILLLSVVTGLVYFIPSIIARKKVNFSRILLLNIFLGWTFLGWAGALVWAIRDEAKA
jgi:hypothetical protein